MFEFLQGYLVKKSPAAAALLVGGVGYEVLIPLSTFESLPEPGREVKVLTHLHVRENEIKLFGFATEAERELFRLLLGVSGIGPMIALQILSSCSVDDFSRYILERDAETLSAMVKGIGRKSAERLIVELGPAMAQMAVGLGELRRSTAAADTVKALVSLGFARPASENAVREATKELGAEADSEELLKVALSICRG